MIRSKITLCVPLLAALLPFTTSCSPEKTTVKAGTLTAEQIETIERVGSAASQTLQKNLGAQLKAALEFGGPEKALHVCQQVAQPLAAKTSEGLPTATVTRTALRVRNPANTPTKQDRAVLSEWENLLSKGNTLPPSKVISTNKNQAIYYQPIITYAMCLKCHGNLSEFSPELSKSLTQLYPNDQAINFTEGSLRGAFRVVVTLD